MRYETEVVKTGGLKEEDIIIAFMGPTGCGKSQVIDLLTGQRGKRSGHTLQSCTRDVTAFRILNHEKYGRQIVLVDTPGFDNVGRSDKQILEMISNWLLKTYKRNLTLAGVIYLHRVNDIRMSEGPHRNLRMFGELSGNKSAKKVILATTMWDKASKTEGEKREVALKERYWNVMIHHGAIVERFLNTRESAWAVINRLVERGRNKSALLLQEELVDLKKQLFATRAGKALYFDLQVLVEKQNRTIYLAAERAEESENGLEAEIDSDMQALQEILEEADNLNTPLRERVARFLRTLVTGWAERSKNRPEASVCFNWQESQTHSTTFRSTMTSFGLDISQTVFQNDQTIVGAEEIMVKEKPRSEEQHYPVMEQAGERKGEVKPEPQSVGSRSLLVVAKEQTGIKVEVRPQRQSGEEHSLSHAAMKGEKKKKDEITVGEQDQVYIKPKEASRDRSLGSLAPLPKKHA